MKRPRILKYEIFFFIAGLLVALQKVEYLSDIYVVLTLLVLLLDIVRKLYFLRK